MKTIVVIAAVKVLLTLAHYGGTALSCCVPKSMRDTLIKRVRTADDCQLASLTTRYTSFTIVQSAIDWHIASALLQLLMSNDYVVAVALTSSVSAFKSSAYPSSTLCCCASATKSVQLSKRLSLICSV
eukprot:10253-Heterococcus_DN1.PRE.1